MTGGDETSSTWTKTDRDHVGWLWRTVWVDCCQLPSCYVPTGWRQPGWEQQAGSALRRFEVENQARTRGVRRCGRCLCGRAPGVRWLCEEAVCVAQPFGTVCLAKRSPGQQNAALNAPIIGQRCSTSATLDTPLVVPLNEPASNA